MVACVPARLPSPSLPAVVWFKLASHRQLTASKARAAAAMRSWAPAARRATWLPAPPEGRCAAPPRCVIAGSRGRVTGAAPSRLLISSSAKGGALTHPTPGPPPSPGPAHACCADTMVGSVTWPGNRCRTTSAAVLAEPTGALTRHRRNRAQRCPHSGDAAPWTRPLHLHAPVRSLPSLPSLAPRCASASTSNAHGRVSRCRCMCTGEKQLSAPRHHVVLFTGTTRQGQGRIARGGGQPSNSSDLPLPQGKSYTREAGARHFWCGMLLPATGVRRRMISQERRRHTHGRGNTFSSRNQACWREKLGAAALWDAQNWLASSHRLSSSRSTESPSVKNPPLPPW